MQGSTATDLPIIHIANSNTIVDDDLINKTPALEARNKGPLLQASALKRQQLKHVFQSSKARLTLHLDQRRTIQPSGSGKALDLKFEKTMGKFKRHSVASRNPVLPSNIDHSTDYFTNNYNYLTSVALRKNSTSRMRLDETRFKQTSVPFRGTSTLNSNASTYRFDPNQDLSSMLRTARDEVRVVPAAQTRQPSSIPLEIVAPGITRDTLREAESCANEFRIGLGVAAPSERSRAQHLKFTRSSAILAGLQTQENKWLEVEDLREELAFKKKLYAQNKFFMLKKINKMMK